MTTSSMQNRPRGPLVLHTRQHVHYAQQHRAAFRCPQSQRTKLCRQQLLIVRAEGDPDTDFEDRLSRLKTAKGQTPYGQSRKEITPAQALKDAKAGKAQPQYDYSGETLYLETPPHRGDLVTNIALGSTLLWLPLTFAAIGRAAFVQYRFTDKRLSVITTAPWKKEQLDAPYQEVKDVVTVGRGLGFWGDMVVTLKNNDKIEMRSLPKFKEVRDYVLKQRDSLKASTPTAASSSGGEAKKGFS